MLNVDLYIIERYNHIEGVFHIHPNPAAFTVLEDAMEFVKQADFISWKIIHMNAAGQVVGAVAEGEREMTVEELMEVADKSTNYGQNDPAENE